MLQIQYASLCLLNNPGCLFIATNADARGHFTPNQEWAGAGATVGAIQGEAWEAFDETKAHSYSNKMYINKSDIRFVQQSIAL